MCGSFKCLKNSLLVLNIFYILVGFILIGVAAYGKVANMLTSLPTVGGIVACGVFLLFISIAGLVGAIKHHQVTLFVYMIVLFVLFFIQFVIACVCLGVTEEQQVNIAEHGWKFAPESLRNDTQKYFHCCGFKDFNITQKACIDFCPDMQKCENCFELVKDYISYGFRASGGVGLFFSFTEILGFCVAYRLRNMANPATGITDIDK